MGDALKSLDRDIVYSLCQYGMGDVFKWGTKVGGNLWRTTGDITDTWWSMSSIGFAHSEKAVGARPGGWNDPDMLVVGHVGWGNPHPSKLTPNEQITHISLWSLLAAPLIIGCDLTKIDSFTQDLLMNHEVIDIDQDPLGRAAVRVATRGDTEVWARPLFDGKTAVGLFNRGGRTSKVTVSWSEIKRNGSQTVRDVWNRRDIGAFAQGYSANVPAHGCVLLTVR
jgi:alpha-galactosidase